MKTILSRMLGAGLFFLLIFLSGFWLNFSGKPYRILFFNAHKLIALAALVFLGFMINKIHRTDPLTTVQILSVAVTGLLFVVTMITGGLMNIGKDLPVFIFRLHHVTPYLTILSSAVTLTMLLRGGQLSPA